MLANVTVRNAGMKNPLLLGRGFERSILQC
jgi:hypothetical protein